MKTESAAIEVSFATSQEFGPCQACDRYDDPKKHTLIAHQVYRIRAVYGQFLRLCPNCKDDLVNKLKKLEP